MLILPTIISKQNLSPTNYTLEASTIIKDIDGCKCDDAVKVEAIKNVLENSKDVDSNLIIQKVKHILKPIKYSDEYFEEDDTKIKLEPVTVKTEPFIKAESIKTEPENDPKIKLEPVSVKTEPCFKVEESRRKRKRSRSRSPKLSPKRLRSQSPHDFEQSFCHDNETNKTQKRKNAKMPQRHSDTESWECPKCLRRCKPRDKLTCYHCGALRPGSWLCHLCDNVNYPEQLRCARRKCQEIRRGNWICPDPDCQFLNWQHSLQCIRTECYEAQPGSWLCRACDVINKRDNETCFLCKGASSIPAQIFEFNAEAEKVRQVQERLRDTEVLRPRPSSPKLHDSNRQSRRRAQEEESGTDWHQVFDEMRVEYSRKTEEENAKAKVVQNRLLALVGQASSSQEQPQPSGSMYQNPNLEPLGIPKKQQKSKVSNYDSMTESIKTRPVRAEQEDAEDPDVISATKVTSKSLHQVIQGSQPGMQQTARYRVQPGPPGGHQPGVPVGAVLLRPEGPVQPQTSIRHVLISPLTVHEAQKEAIMREVLEDHISPNELAKKYNIRAYAIREWIKKARHTLPKNYKRFGLNLFPQNILIITSFNLMMITF